MVLYVSYLRDKMPRSPVVDIHSSIAFPFHRAIPPLRVMLQSPAPLGAN